MQVQYSLLDRRPENGMSELCENANVKLLPFGTVAGGFLTEKYIGFPQEKCAFTLSYLLCFCCCRRDVSVLNFLLVISSPHTHEMMASC